MGSIMGSNQSKNYENSQLNNIKIFLIAVFLKLYCCHEMNKLFTKIYLPIWDDLE